MANCTDLEDINFCVYFNATNPWGPFEPPSLECFRFQVNTRTCQSPNTTECPCVGTPFDISVCPDSSSITEQSILLEWKTVSLMMANDERSIYYLNEGNEAGLHERAKQLMNS